MRMLLHACCGPCLIEPLDALRADHEVTVLYANPNIQPREEYDRRLATLRTYASDARIAVIEEAKHVGADVSEGERLISKAKTAIAAKEYLLASELIKRAERSAMESQQNQIRLKNLLRNAEEKLLAYQEQLRSMASELTLLEERERRQDAEAS